MPATNRSPLRLVLIEASDAFSATVERLLAAEPDAPFVVRFAAVDDALVHLTQADVDCVLLESSALERVLAADPTMPLVALADGDEGGLRALRAGAQDHVVRGEETGALLLRAARHAIERRRTGDRHEVERLVREVVDEVGRVPHRDEQRRRIRRERVLPPALGLAAIAAAVLSGPVAIALACLMVAALAQVARTSARRARQRDELLRGILDGTSDAFAIKDVNGRYLLANDALAGQTGLRSGDEVLGLSDDDLLPPELAAGVRARDHAVLATGQTQAYWRTITVAGFERTMSVVKLPYRDVDGAIRGTVTIARDETAMRRLEEQTTRFFDLAPDLLCTAGPDGRLERINDAWTRVLGWSPEELRSRPLIDFIHPEDRLLAGQEVELLLAGVIESCTNRVATRSGGWRKLEWSARVIPEERRVYGVARDVTERDALARALEEGEERYRTLVHNLPGATVLTYDHDLRFTFAAGDGLAAIAPEGGVVGRPMHEVWPAIANRLGPTMRAALGGSPQAFEYEANNGGTYWVQLAPLRDGDGAIVGGMVLGQDITERRAVEREVTQAEGRFRSAFDQAPIGMALVSLEGRFLQVNEAFCAITGRGAEDLLDRTVESITHPDDAAADVEGRRALRDGRSDVDRVEKRYVQPDGRIVWVDVQSSLVRDADGRPVHILGQIQDVTERRRVERRLQHLADHDPLTGLLNRRRFELELTRHVAEVQRYGATGGLLVLDLDDFKLVNDSLGHSAGDELIVAIAGILRGQLRESDVVARLGGDEFAVLLPRADADEAEAVAEKLVCAVREEATVIGNSRPLRVTTSIGIAMFGRERVSAEEMLINADLSMYDAKEAGRDGWAMHVEDGDARPRVQARMHWLERIRDAVANDRLVLHAQPIRDLRTGQITQHELLVRLLDETGDLIPPAVFLPLAERYDLVQLIDRWVVRRALELVAEHAARGLRLTVNLSGRTLSDEGLLETLQRELERTGADPDCLTFEVTETAAVSNIHRAREFAERLREIGCRFALDDFGAGFGSFYYLKHLPFDYLKIDGEFVANCLSNRTDQLVIRAVVDIAQGLGKETVAEFASDPELVRFLETQGVDYAQGFEVGRPVPLDQVLASLGASAA